MPSSSVEVLYTGVMPRTVVTHIGTCINPQSLKQGAGSLSKVELSKPSNEPNSSSESDEDVVYEALKIFPNINEGFRRS